MTKTIFVVDDNDINLTMAKEALKGQYRVMTLPSAPKMFALMEKITPDLILLDIEMPEMDGFEALRLLKADETKASIPVVFLTGMSDAAVEASGFQLGVIDFIAKPFSAPVLNNRIKAHLDIDDIIRERTSQLYQKTLQLQKIQNGTVFVVSDIIESRDKGTGGHVERTVVYLNMLLEAMTARGLYVDDICEIDANVVFSAACLHDVGKIAISDTILNKPGKLTDEEFEMMKTHCAEGEHIIEQIILRTEDVAFLRSAKLSAGCHHERWDGKGYPNRLEKTDIPTIARLVSIVDVYDALISERPYKRAFSHDEAMKSIMEGAGSHFDPLIAEVFGGISVKLQGAKR